MRVTLARNYETEDGKKVKADQTVDLPDSEARNLLFLGHARAAEEKATATNTDKKEGN